MSLVGFRGMLVHTCDVLRQSAGTSGAHGHSTATWATHLSGLRCRVMENTGQELNAPVDASLTRRRVFLEGGQDIQETDRLVTGGATYEVVDVVTDVAGAGEIMRVVVQRVDA